MSVRPSVRLSVCLSACLLVCLSVRLSVCLSVCLSDRPFVCLSACLSVCLSVCLFVCLFVCLSVCPSVWVSFFLFFPPLTSHTHYMYLIFFFHTTWIHPKHDSCITAPSHSAVGHASISFSLSLLFSTAKLRAQLQFNTSTTVPRRGYLYIRVKLLIITFTLLQQKFMSAQLQFNTSKNVPSRDTFISVLNCLLLA
jgi:hypothetical protein